MKNIVIFASGTGSNAENIIRFFSKNDSKRVAAVFCNNPNALVLEKAKQWNVPTVVFTKEELSGTFVWQQLQKFETDLIVLAGFLWMFPKVLIQAYPNKVINIHPALLPKYGGKGMYGNHVHEAVLKNNETETGITIHYVNEHYDEGGIIFQKSVSIAHCKTVEEVAQKIQELEHECFPEVISKILL